MPNADGKRKGRESYVVSLSFQEREREEERERERKMDQGRLIKSKKKKYFTSDSVIGVSVSGFFLVLVRSRFFFGSIRSSLMC